MGCYYFFTNLSCLNFVHQLKNILPIIFSVIGLALAFKGLNTWKLQLKGTEKYNLARSAIITIFFIQELIKSINPLFLQRSSDSYEGSTNYFKYLDYVQNKLIDKKSEISFFLLQLKAIHNFKPESNLEALFDYLERSVNYIPYLTSEKADLEELQKAYNFFYKSDFKDLDAAVNKAVKPFQSILNK